MTTLINRGFSLLNRVMEPAAAETVTYKRGAKVIGEGVLATLSNQQIEQLTSADTAIVGRQFTWRVKRSDLVIDGSEVQPESFDRIEWYRNGRVYVFQVMPELGLPESNSVDPRSDWVPASVKLVEVQ